MEDVKNALWTLLKSDATLQNQLGGAEGDRRIYVWYPESEIKLSDSKPAFITFYQVSVITHIDLEAVQYAIDIWSEDEGLCEQIFATVDGLLHYKELTCANHWNLLTRRVSVGDAGRTEDGKYVKSLVYELEVTAK